MCGLWAVTVGLVPVRFWRVVEITYSLATMVRNPVFDWGFVSAFFGSDIFPNVIDYSVARHETHVCGKVIKVKPLLRILADGFYKLAPKASFREREGERFPRRRRFHGRSRFVVFFAFFSIDGEVPRGNTVVRDSLAWRRKKN